MAGCNCKGKTNKDSSTNKESKQTVITYMLKIVMFLIFLCLLPIIMGAIIWFGFRTLILNKEIDIKPLLIAIGKKFKEKDDEESEYENLTEDDVIMVDVEDITNKRK